VAKQSSGWQERLNLAAATGLPRRFAPRNDVNETMADHENLEKL
jgi:hypothetical protein